MESDGKNGMGDEKQGEKNMVEISADELIKWDKSLSEKRNEAKKIEKEIEMIGLEVKQLKNQMELAKKKREGEIEPLKGVENRNKTTASRLEESNSSLSALLDKIATQGQLFQGKIKDFELFKETQSRLMREKQDEIKFFKERTSKDSQSRNELSVLTEQLTKSKGELKVLEEQASVLEKRHDEYKREEPLFREKADRFKKVVKDIESYSLDLDSSVKLESEMSVRVEKEVNLRVHLTGEIEELQQKQKNYELQLEEESRAAREDLIKLKKVDHW